MRCPFCREDNDKVVDSRLSENGFAIRRRRLCLSCNRRYTTSERLLDIGLKVIKKNGILEPFDPQKIRAGLQKACWKRAISEEQIEKVISDVEQEVYSNFDMEIESGVLGEIVIEQLMKIDQVAYVRFASVYREFKDVKDFVEELRPILNKNTR